MGSGTSGDPWELTTAPGSSTYTMHLDEEADPPLLVCHVASTRLHLPPLLEALGRAELTHEPPNNKVRGI